MEETFINEIEMNRIVYTTNNYAVALTNIMEENGNWLPVYGVFNREYGIREAELRGYPYAVRVADQLQDAFNNMVQERVAADVERNKIEEALGVPAVEEEEDIQLVDDPVTPDEAEDLLESAVSVPEKSE